MLLDLKDFRRLDCCHQQALDRAGPIRARTSDSSFRAILGQGMLLDQFRRCCPRLAGTLCDESIKRAKKARLAATSSERARSSAVSEKAMFAGDPPHWSDDGQ